MEETTGTKPMMTLQTAPKIKSRNKLIVGAILIILIIVMGIWFYLMKPQNPIPENTRKQVNFPIYYPKELPVGYKLDKNSIKAESSILFFSLAKENEMVNISEQATPQNKPDLKNTPGFGEIPSAAGEASAGTINGLPIAIIVGDKTMINISGSKNVPKDTLTKIVQSMNSLSN